jgi:hypothetical protein
LPSYKSVYGAINRFIDNIITVLITNRTWSWSQWPLDCRDCGFESRQGHRCLCLVSVICFQVEVSASSWSLFQRIPECDRESSAMRTPRSTGGCCANVEDKTYLKYVTN